MQIRLTFLLILTIMTRFSLAQTNENRVLLHAAIDSVRQIKIDDPEPITQKLINPTDGDSLLGLAIEWQFRWLKSGDLTGFPKAGVKHFEGDTSFNSAVFNLYYGDFLKNSGVYDTLAFKHFYQGYEIANSMRDSLLICQALQRMIIQIIDKEKNTKLLETLSSRYVSFAVDDFEKDMALLLRTRVRSFINKLS